MYLVLSPEVQEYTLNYVDDLLVVSSDREKHFEHLEMLLYRLELAGMTIN